MHRPGILVDADELVEALQTQALDAAEPDPVLLHRTEIHALPPVFSIQRAVLYGLGDVLGLDALRAGQVGDGARNLQHAGVGAVGELEPFAGEQKQLMRLVAGLAGGIQVAGGELGVDADAVGIVGIAPALNLPRGLHPPADIGGALLRTLPAQPLGGDGLHLDVHVDAVQQRPGDAVQIAPDGRLGAAAGLGAAAQVAAGLCCVY